MVFQLQTNSPSKLKKSWFFKNIFFLYEFLSKIQIGFDYHRTWWYQFFRYFLCKIFSPEISCDFDLSSSRSSLRSLAENMKRYMVLVMTRYETIVKFWCPWILLESYPIMHSPWYHSSSNSDLGYVQKSQTTSRNIIQGWNQKTNDVLEKDNSFTFRSFALNFGVHFVKVLKKI